MNWQVRVLMALVAGALIFAVRFVPESNVASLIKGDAQLGLWVVGSMIVSLATALFAVPLIYGVLSNVTTPGNRAIGVVFLVLALLPVGCTGHRLVRLSEIRAALLDAENPATPPDRLEALVGYETGFGYEVDNRLARNPSTPPHVLRVLSEIPNQTGTLSCLAMNPSTPDDILLAIANRNDRWAEYMQQSLAANPRWPAVRQAAEAADHPTPLPAAGS